VNLCRSQWPRGLRRGSAAARLLGLWVRIPPGTWMLIPCGCCMLSNGVANESDREAPLGDAMTRNRVEAPQKKANLYLGRSRQLSRYSDSPRAWRSGVCIPVGARYSAPIQIDSEAHSSSSSSEVKWWVEQRLYSPYVPSGLGQEWLHLFVVGIKNDGLSCRGVARGYYGSPSYDVTSHISHTKSRLPVRSRRRVTRSCDPQNMKTWLNKTKWFF
jgi:hypothetical protein